MTDFASRWRRPALLPPRALLLALLCQAPLLFVSWPWRPGAITIYAGALLLVAGILVNVVAARVFRLRAVGICPFSATPALVEEGPYRFSRNPMYVGLVAVCAGATLVTGALPNLWVPVAYCIWLHHAYVLPEERFLREHFGAAWDRYAQRVPRWLLVH